MSGLIYPTLLESRVRQNQKSLVRQLKAHTVCPAIGARSGLLNANIVGSPPNPITHLQTFTVDPADPDVAFTGTYNPVNSAQFEAVTKAMTRGKWQCTLSVTPRTYSALPQQWGGNFQLIAWYLNSAGNALATQFGGLFSIMYEPVAPDFFHANGGFDQPIPANSTLGNPYTFNVTAPAACYWAFKINWTSGGSLLNFAIQAVRIG